MEGRWLGRRGSRAAGHTSAGMMAAPAGSRKGRAQVEAGGSQAAQEAGHNGRRQRLAGQGTGAPAGDPAEGHRRHDRCLERRWAPCGACSLLPGTGGQRPAPATCLEVCASSLRRLWMPRTAPPRDDRLLSALFRSQHWPRSTSFLLTGARRRRRAVARHRVGGGSGGRQRQRQRRQRWRQQWWHWGAALGTGDRFQLHSLMVPPSSPMVVDTAAA